MNRYVDDHIIYFHRDRRIALVVEADNAIGYSLCKKLIKKNYHVILGVSDVKRGVKYDLGCCLRGRIKLRLLRFRSYASVSIIAIDTTNPMNVMYAAKRIVQNYKSIDVLYLNNSLIRIDHFNWDVLKKALLTLRLSYFCSTGRACEDGKNFVSVKGSGTTELGFNRDFCQQVLSPFILVMELKDLLKEAGLPGRVVWTGSSTCWYLLN